MNDYAVGKTWKMEKQQYIMEVAFHLFAERGIEAVSMQEIAQASRMGRATLFRYYNTKLDLAVAIGTEKWMEFIRRYRASITDIQREEMTAARRLRFYMDSFIDLYCNHKELLCFNYYFNSYLRNNPGTAEQRQNYMRMIENLGRIFHQIYERGRKDKTLRTDLSEENMFSCTFHIMLAAAARYAVGLVYIAEGTANPEKELTMLKEILLSRFLSE